MFCKNDDNKIRNKSEKKKKPNQTNKQKNKQTKSHPAHPNQTQVMQTQIMKKKTRNVLFNVNILFTENAHFCYLDLARKLCAKKIVPNV
jgi:hypothetical protein